MCPLPRQQSCPGCCSFATCVGATQPELGLRAIQWVHRSAAQSASSSQGVGLCTRLRGACPSLGTEHRVACQQFSGRAGCKRTCAPAVRQWVQPFYLAIISSSTDQPCPSKVILLAAPRCSPRFSSQARERYCNACCTTHQRAGGVFALLNSRFGLGWSSGRAEVFSRTMTHGTKSFLAHAVGCSGQID